jgi:uncharacterized DUF497 family protein
MALSFDPEKSERNKAKHGIDFYEAQSFWNDHDPVEIAATTSNQTRFLIVGAAFLMPPIQAGESRKASGIFCLCRGQ